MSSPGGNPPSINVTPLIDVLLVLLIIFMVIPHRASTLETKIPQKPLGDPLPAASEQLVVVVQPDGHVELNTRAVDLENLQSLLIAALELRSDRTVFIKAPTRLPYQEIVSVVDAVTGSGASPIGLQVDFLEEPPANQEPR